ncbi:hypothetical protein BDW74DRAFT_178988 [Aspergillus multicolor]|uniref:putative GPI anchored protein n=1 Tax=Aspergillus multicolor TaxID=41759 RepID=UPI003CCD5D5A
MRLQQLFTVSSLILAGNIASGADIYRNDVPTDCHSACDPLMSISQRCDRQHVDSASEAQCICDADDARNIISRCEACTAQYRSNHPQGDNDNDGDDNDDDDDDNSDTGPHDNDAYDMLTACSLQTTSYQPSSSGGGGSSSGGSSSSGSSSSGSSSSGSSSSGSSSSGSSSSSSGGGGSRRNVFILKPTA